MRRRHWMSCLVLAVVAMAISPTASVANAQQPSATPPAKVDTRQYELRLETAQKGKLNELQKQVREVTAPLLKKHGAELLYSWTVTKGANSDGESAADMLVSIYAHKDRAAAEAAWVAIKADPQWVALTSGPAAEVRKGEPVQIYMTATAFSAADPQPVTAADAAPRLFELRKYNDGEARLPGTVDRFDAGEAALFSKNGMETLHFWTADDKSAFIYLLAHKDQAAADASWQKFFAEFRVFQTEYNGKVAEGKRPNARRAEGGAPPARGARGARGGGSEIRYLVPTADSPRK